MINNIVCDNGPRSQHNLFLGCGSERSRHFASMLLVEEFQQLEFVLLITPV